MQVVVYILNIIPSTVVGDISPFEKLYGKPPSLSPMRVVGCLCFASNLPKQDKFSPRAVRSVLVGYGTTQKGYRLYDLENGVFFTSRNVMFMEKDFSFKGSSTD